MKLCEYCVEHILKSKDSWDYHRCDTCVNERTGTTIHQPAHKVSRDAIKEERCLFCSTLLDDIEEYIGRFDGYRWTKRSLSKIRESLETIVVTFHPIPAPSPIPSGDPRVPDKPAQDATLPVRKFYFFPQDVLGPWPTREELGRSTNPAKNGGAQIKSWLTTCDETHQDCMKRRKARSASTRFVPTRLLDISGPPGSHMKVIETAKTAVRSPYATLSHCWGLKQFVRLLPETEKEYIEEEGVPWKLLTKNFQEAIEVARFMEIEYIWIDSLCIIQGPHGDFGTEGGLMHQIYRNSYCNIAIVDSEDSEGGAFRDKRDPDDVVPTVYQAGPEERSSMFGSKAWRVVAGDIYERELLNTKLYVRGWVFQERMLAPRCLQFAKRQIFWDCATISACESIPFGLPSPIDGAARPDRHWRSRLQEPDENALQYVGPSDFPLMEFWKSAVRRYTRCALTKGADKMIAIWGIAKIVRDGLGIEYGLGLWEQNLEDQLTWRVAKCTLTERPTDSKLWNLERSFPTWSWASMDGPIEIADRLSQSNKKHWTVKDRLGKDGKDLKFDLVGVRRPMRPPTRLAEASSPTQSRAMSDTAVEQQARLRELERTTSTKNAPDAGATTNEKVDRNAEPKFYSTSLSIAGHVGGGQLQLDSALNQWRLSIEGVDTEIEAFPDLIPQPGTLDFQPYFVALSAKQVVDPDEAHTENPYEAEDDDSQGSDSDQDPDKDQDSDDNQEPDNHLPLTERLETKEFFVAGRGILMKKVGVDRFHRTGAFRFDRISNTDWAKLLEPALIRFWLD